MEFKRCYKIESITAKGWIKAEFQVYGQWPLYMP